MKIDENDTLHKIYFENYILIYLNKQMILHCNISLFNYEII